MSNVIVMNLEPDNNKHITSKVGDRIILIIFYVTISCKLVFCSYNDYVLVDIFILICIIILNINIYIY